MTKISHFHRNFSINDINFNTLSRGQEIYDVKFTKDKCNNFIQKHKISRYFYIILCRYLYIIIALFK